MIIKILLIHLQITYPKHNRIKSSLFKIIKFFVLFLMKFNIKIILLNKVKFPINLNEINNLLNQ